MGRTQGATVRLGAIDSAAAAGLLPASRFCERRPDVTVKLTEDKTIRLLPRSISGRLDVALVRLRKNRTGGLNFCFSFTRQPSSPYPIIIPSRRENE
jgi:DNA-binding transcriptional LysR family regulator